MAANDKLDPTVQILLDQGKITQAEIEQAKELQAKTKNSLEAELQKFGAISQEDLMEAQAKQFGMVIHKDLSPFPFSPELRSKVPYSFVKKHIVLPLEQQLDGILVAVNDPLNLAPLEDLRMMLGSPVKAVYSPRDVILEATRLRYDRNTAEASQLISNLKGEASDQEGELESYDLLEERKEQSPIIRLLNLILTEAIQQGASDVHFEPSEDELRVRYRIDGVLQDRHTPPQEYQAQLLTRIKVMSKLDIAEHRLPQDGRIKLKMGGREIDFRVSTVPVVHGERIVLRILDKGNIVLGLDSIGMPQDVLSAFRRLIRLPEGIVLVTGPTGSGKTTTLYSAISEINSDEINIMTIEDPVEYKLPGIAQIQVRPKIQLSFARGLRHILRQDPDVVMIGEIRDKETAEIAIQASLTGHFVMSTLHTNDAPSALTRLVDMGVESYLLSSTVVGVMAQRLVRTICSECREDYEPSDVELQDLGLERDELPTGKVSRGKGCKQCFNSGYKGRQGIYELMTVSSDVKQQITKSADAVELRRLAIQCGMKSLHQRGSELVKQGRTTVAEVLRVTRGVEV